jgi:hypothetical protein
MNADQRREAIGRLEAMRLKTAELKAVHVVRMQELKARSEQSRQVGERIAALLRTAEARDKYRSD